MYRLDGSGFSASRTGTSLGNEIECVSQRYQMFFDWSKMGVGDEARWRLALSYGNGDTEIRFVR